MDLRSRAPDLAAIAATSLLATSYLVYALRMPFWTAGGIPGGGFLPALLGVAMLLFSIALLIQTLTGEPRVGSGLDWRASARPRSVLMALVGYLAVFRWLGYVLASVALISVLLWLFEPRRLTLRRTAAATAVSVVIVGLFYLVFVRLLALDIPAWPSGR